MCDAADSARARCSLMGVIRSRDHASAAPTLADHDDARRQNSHNFYPLKRYPVKNPMRDNSNYQAYHHDDDNRRIYMVMLNSPEQVFKV